MTIREDDAELLAALTNWARNLKYGPDQDWLETAVDRLTALSSEREILRERVMKAREMVRLFPEAYDVLTRQEMRDAKGSWRSLIDQQNNALEALRAALDTGVTGG
jgi:hypothetical protein